MSQLFLFSSAMPRDPAIEVWMRARPAALIDDAALQKRIQTAYADMRKGVRAQSRVQAAGWCCR